MNPNQQQRIDDNNVLNVVYHMMLPDQPALIYNELNHISQRLWSLWNSREEHDLILVIEKESFYVHRHYLALVSSYFATFFREQRLVYLFLSIF